MCVYIFIAISLVIEWSIASQETLRRHESTGTTFNITGSGEPTAGIEGLPAKAADVLCHTAPNCFQRKHVHLTSAQRKINIPITLIPSGCWACQPSMGTSSSEDVQRRDKAQSTGALRLFTVDWPLAIGTMFDLHDDRSLSRDLYCQYKTLPRCVYIYVYIHVHICVCGTQRR